MQQESGNTHTQTRKCVRHSEVFACVGGGGMLGTVFVLVFKRFEFWILFWAAMEEMK